MVNASPSRPASQIALQLARRAAGALAAAVLLAPAGAFADGAREPVRTSGHEPMRASTPATVPGDTGPVWLDIVPEQCSAFTPFIGRPDSEAGWRRLLSLGACVQDASLGAADEPEELEAMVDELSRRLALPMLIYLDALEHGEGPIQLRAAYQIGMAYVSLSTRARASIPAPADLEANTAAEGRYRELHARLEPLLVPARRAAWVSFHAITEAAAHDPSIARDEVERYMVCSARRMLPGLRDAAPERRLLVEAVEPAPCGAPPITAAAP